MPGLWQPRIRFRKCKRCKHIGAGLDFRDALSVNRVTLNAIDSRTNSRKTSRWKEPNMLDAALEVREPLHEDPAHRVHQLASDRFRNDPDWVTFYREVLGVGGIIDQLLPSHEARSRFSLTAQFAEIQQMLAKLREKNRGQKVPEEATRVITVRLPKSLHEALRHEAHNHRTSMNKLCISKLLQVISGELVPSDFERRDDEPEARPATDLQMSQSSMSCLVPVEASPVSKIGFGSSPSPEPSPLDAFATAPTAGGF